MDNIVFTIGLQILLIALNAIFACAEIAVISMNDNKLEPLVTVEDLKTIKPFEAIIIIPRMMPFKTKLLHDYQIDWGIKFEDTEIPTRKYQNIKTYEEKN